MITFMIYMLFTIGLFGFLFYRWVVKDKSSGDFAAIQKFLKRIKGR